MFAAGTVQQAQAILPDLKELLGDRSLSYVFVSRMESDEAAGVFVLKKEWPDIKVLCGELTARELPGYGYQGSLIAKHGGDSLKEGELDLVFFDYPSEVHLQNGLLAYEKNSGIFYSADLFLRYGKGIGNVIEGIWEDEVNAINEERIPNIALRSKFQKELAAISPAFAVVGHGFCLNYK